MRFSKVAPATAADSKDGAEVPVYADKS